MLSKIALQDIDFLVKKNLSKYIEKEFSGDTTKLKKSSKIIRSLVEVKDREIKS